MHPGHLGSDVGRARTRTRARPPDKRTVQWADLATLDLIAALGQRRERAPRLAETHALLDDLFAFPRTRGELVFLPDLLAMRANLTADLAVAVPLSTEAIAIARGQGARSYELRAALLLAQRTGDTAALATALAGFTEGAGTRDQIEARALLGHRDS